MTSCELSLKSLWKKLSAPINDESSKIMDIVRGLLSKVIAELFNVSDLAEHHHSLQREDTVRIANAIIVVSILKSYVQSRSSGECSRVLTMVLASPISLEVPRFCPRLFRDASSRFIFGRMRDVPLRRNRGR
jgi:hypothetical protein